MSREFLDIAALEIPRGQEPDWDAADKHIEALPEEECREHLEDLDDYEDMVSELMNADEDDTCKDILRAVSDEIYLGFKNGHPCIRTIQLGAVTVVLGGGTTDGPDLPEKSMVMLFRSCGAAAAAGFLVDDDAAGEQDDGEQDDAAGEQDDGEQDDADQQDDGEQDDADDQTGA